jgi:hypothetical protein
MSELVVPDSKALVVNDELLAAMGMTAEELQAQQGIAGMENARAEDFQIPRLQISQALSPQLMRTKPEYIPGLQVGQFFNTVTGEVYGDAIQVVPVKYSVSRLKFTNNVLDCQSKNGVDGGHYSKFCSGCEKAKWGSGKDGKGTDCKEYRNWLLLDAKTGSPMSMSFKSASLAVAKTWATLIAGRKITVGGIRKDAPAYLTVYELKTVEKSVGNNTFFVPIVKVVAPTPTELVKEAAGLLKTFKGEFGGADTDSE